MTDTPDAREFRELQEKLNSERSSAVHLRIAAVEAQARADREAQALVNQRLGDRIDGVKGVVDDLKTSTDSGFKDTRAGMLGLGILMLLVLAANLPGLFAILKGKLP